MLKVPITYPGSELQWVIRHLLLGMPVHLSRSWPHSPVTYQRTFSGVVPWDNCLCFLLVICFQISNNTELISRDKESPLNSFCFICTYAWNKKGYKVYFFFFFFFLDYRQCMFFVGNLKNTTKYKENKNHLNPTTITLFKTTFPGFDSVIGWAQRHFWLRCMKKGPQ